MWLFRKLRWWFWNLLRIRKLFSPTWWRVMKVAKTCKPVTTNVNVMPRPICIGYLEYPSLLALRDSEFAHQQIFWIDVPEKVLKGLYKKRGDNNFHIDASDALATLKEMGYKSRPMQ